MFSINEHDFEVMFCQYKQINHNCIFYGFRVLQVGFVTEE
jgi:hypothetical protein